VSITKKKNCHFGPNLDFHLARRRRRKRKRTHTRRRTTTTTATATTTDQLPSKNALSMVPKRDTVVNNGNKHPQQPQQQQQQSSSPIESNQTTNGLHQLKNDTNDNKEQMNDEEGQRKKINLMSTTSPDDGWRKRIKELFLFGTASFDNNDHDADDDIAVMKMIESPSSSSSSSSPSSSSPRSTEHDISNNNQQQEEQQEQIQRRRRRLFQRNAMGTTILALAVYLFYKKWDNSNNNNRTPSKKQRSMLMTILLSLVSSKSISEKRQLSSFLSSPQQYNGTVQHREPLNHHSKDISTRQQEQQQQPQQQQYPQYLQIWKFVSSLFLTTNLLSSLLRRPEYATAREVSLSILRKAAQNGQIQKALIGPSTIVFFSKTTTPATTQINHDRSPDGRWNRTVLPSIDGIQSTMMDLLSTGGCDDISALPQPFSSRLVTPLLTAVPFIYLAFVYRLLKHMRDTTTGIDGDSTSSSFTSFLSTRLLSGRDEAPTSRRGSSSSSTNHPSIPRTRFTDIAGLDSIVPEVQEIVSYLSHPRMYQTIGAQPPRGILFHGPPGGGKTLLARALAGEAGCDAFIACTGSDFCEMYVGRGAARIRSLFHAARTAALQRHRQQQQQQQLHNQTGIGWWFPSTPWPYCLIHNNNNGNENKGSEVDPSSSPILERPATAIIFIDELDALAKNRSHGGIMNSNDERDQTLNQLLTEMDGFFEDGTTCGTSKTMKKKINTKGGDNDTNINKEDIDDDDDNNNRVILIVIGATNRAQVLDPAILRRFDRQIYVPYPDLEGRKAILKIHASKTQCRFSTVNWDFLAEQTVHFSGSDLKQVVNDAALLAVRQKKERVDQNHLLHAIQRAPASSKVQRGYATTSRQQQHLHASGNQPQQYYSSFGPSSSSSQSSSSPLFQLGRNNGSRHDKKEPPLMWLPPEDD
jgi:ATP-dependent Zn protease